MPLLSRRVPLYVSLPVIAGCGVVGYVVSTWQPGATPDPPARPNQIADVPNTAPSEPQLAPAAGILPTVALPIEEIDLPTPALPATKLEPLKTNPDDNVRSSPVVALPIEEIDLPTPALPATKLEPLKTDPDDNVRSAPAFVPTIKAAARPPHADRPVRSTSKARPQRQRSAPPSPPPTGLTSIPIIGPVFSLLQ